MTSIHLGRTHISGMTPREGYFHLGSCLLLCPPQNNPAPEGIRHTGPPPGERSPPPSPSTLTMASLFPQMGLPSQTHAFSGTGCVSLLRLGSSSGRRRCLSS